MSQSHTTQGIPDEAIEHLGSELHKAMGGQSMEEHVESAIETLNDDDAVAFALVGIREGDDGYQKTSHRVVDPAKVRDVDDPDEFIDSVHEAICLVFDNEVRDPE